MTRMSVACAIATGVFLCVSFPSFQWAAVAFFALVPLLIALREKSLTEAFTLGLIAGLAAHIGILYWIVFVVVHYGYVPVYIGVTVMLLLALYMSLYTAVFAWAVVWFHKRGVSVWITAPFLWTSLEYVRSVFLTGFPWENLGYSQYPFLPIMQLADVTGIYGISFIVVLVNCIVYDIVTKKQMRRITGEGLLVILVIGAVTGHGVYRMNDIDKACREESPLTVSLIQGNIDQSVKWEETYQKTTLDRYSMLTRRAVAENPDLIVWPETALPFFFQCIDENHRRVREMARTTGAYFIFGSPSLEIRDDSRVGLNSAYLLSPDARVIGRYDKVHLVPFGEYVPLSRILFFVDKLVSAVGNFASGPGHEPLNMGAEKLGVLICYEAIFPSISRTYRRKGATLLVNLTNDAWFGRSSAPKQHMIMTACRAIENRVSVVRAANTGISAIIDPTGRITERTPLFEEAELTGPVAMIDRSSFYTRYGDIFSFLSIAVVVMIGFYAKKKGRKT